MPINDAVLKTEIDTDPNGYGLVAMRDEGNDQGIADALNLERDTITVKRTDVTAAEIFQSVNMADMPALPTNPNAAALSQERRDLAWLTGLGAIDRALRLINDDGTNTQIRANLARIFSTATQTRDRLEALGTRIGSRAEQLFGAGTSISHSHVSTALRG